MQGDAQMKRASAVAAAFAIVIAIVHVRVPPKVLHPTDDTSDVLELGLFGPNPSNLDGSGADVDENELLYK